tara:strand:+ start:2297 stop:2809 length:513 start_codon:yes stop_codon:yes gene_type:complete
MKIVFDTLSDEIFQRIVGELNIKIPSPLWNTSTVLWDKVLKQGLPGSVMTTPVSEDLAKLIEDSVKDKVPEYDRLIVQFYLWQGSSGIAIHNDENHGFGATIYVNTNWHPNSGGWFIWQDKHNKEWKTLLPEKNVMVVNDEEEEHLVTAIEPYPPEPRVTIQLWGETNDK